MEAERCLLQHQPWQQVGVLRGGELDEVVRGVPVQAFALQHLARDQQQPDAQAGRLQI